MTPPVVYLDHHAHTPLDPKVRDALSRAWVEADVNIHTGAAASEAARLQVEEARVAVAALVGAAAADVVFTSGATEANSLAILGLGEHLRRTDRKRVVISAGEHASIHAAVDALGDEFDVQTVPLSASGQVDLAQLDHLINERTGLVSIAAANHEIGALQPLDKIGGLARSRGALFHSDLAQAAGKIPVALGEDVQLASVSAHKLYGPLGVGALIVRRPVRRVLRAQLNGGGQEQGLRSGTLPAPLCIAFGEACRIAANALAEDMARIRDLRDRLLATLRDQADARVNGSLDARLPGNLNVHFLNVDAEALVMRLREEVVIATGSACHSRALEPSPVLMALGLSRANAESSVRIGLGRSSTEADIDRAAQAICTAVSELRAVRRSLRA